MFQVCCWYQQHQKPPGRLGENRAYWNLRRTNSFQLPLQIFACGRGRDASPPAVSIFSPHHSGGILTTFGGVNTRSSAQIIDPLLQFYNGHLYDPCSYSENLLPPTHHTLDPTYRLPLHRSRHRARLGPRRLGTLQPHRKRNDIMLPPRLRRRQHK